MTTPATAILVPVLGRPQNVAPLVESIEQNTPEPHRTLFVLSVGDVAELEAIEAYYQDHGEVFDYQLVGEPGTWARKINAGFAATEEPFVFLAADDLKFHGEWLLEALYVMGWNDTLEADRRIHVVGTNDLGNERTWSRDPHYVHATHSLVRRSYIDELGGTMDQGPGTVLFEGYAHEYADDELIETAKARGVYAHAYDSIVEHLHPDFGKAPQDDTYAWGRNDTAGGRRRFQERSAALGFGEHHHANQGRTAAKMAALAQLDEQGRRQR